MANIIARPGLRGWISPIPGYPLHSNLRPRQPVLVLPDPDREAHTVKVQTDDGHTYHVLHWLVDCGFTFGPKGLRDDHPEVVAMLTEAYWMIHALVPSANHPQESIGEDLSTRRWWFTRRGLIPPECITPNCRNCATAAAYDAELMHEGEEDESPVFGVLDLNPPPPTTCDWRPYDNIPYTPLTAPWPKHFRRLES